MRCCAARYVDNGPAAEAAGQRARDHCDCGGVRDVRDPHWMTQGHDGGCWANRSAETEG